MGADVQPKKERIAEIVQACSGPFAGFGVIAPVLVRERDDEFSSSAGG
jgi:hypothetical protein